MRRTASPTLLRLSAAQPSQRSAAALVWLAVACFVSASCADDASTPRAPEDAGVASDAATDVVSDAPAPREPAALILSDAWTLLGDDADPFVNERPEERICQPEGYHPEDLAGEAVFSIETGLCNYISVAQPLRADIRTGDVVTGRLWHFELNAPEDSEAVARFATLDGELLWEVVVPIPSDSALLLPQWTATRDLDAGTPIVFHLRNHGANSWSLIDLLVIPPAP